MGGARNLNLGNNVRAKTKEQGTIHFVCSKRRLLFSRCVRQKT